MGQWKQHFWLAHVYTSYAVGEQLAHVCEGAFISESYVITAASCLNKKVDGRRAEATSIRVLIARKHFRRVVKFEYPRHHDNSGSYDPEEEFDFHNVALMKLGVLQQFDEDQQNVDQNQPDVDYQYLISKFRDIKTWSSSPSYKGCQVTGWENVRQQIFQRSISQIKFHRLKVHDTEKCISPTLRPDTIEKFHSHHLCAHESTSNGIVPGSPLTCVDDDGRLVLHGIASYDGYMPINRHKTYTKISEYLRSIRQIIREWKQEGKAARLAAFGSGSPDSRLHGSGSPNSRLYGSGSQCSNRDEDCQSVGSNRPLLNGCSFEGQDNDAFEN